MRLSEEIAIPQHGCSLVSAVLTAANVAEAKVEA